MLKWHLPEGYPNLKQKRKSKSSPLIEVVRQNHKRRKPSKLDKLPAAHGQEQVLSTRATSRQCQDLHLDRAVRAWADLFECGDPLSKACDRALIRLHG